MATSDYTVNFSLALMRKDLTYSIDEAARAGVQLRTAERARELYATAMAQGLGRQRLLGDRGAAKRDGGSDGCQMLP